MTDRQTEVGDCNIPVAFLKNRGDKNANYCWHFNIYEYDKCHAQLHENSFITSGMYYRMHL